MHLRGWKKTVSSMELGPPALAERTGHLKLMVRLVLIGQGARSDHDTVTASGSSFCSLLSADAGPETLYLAIVDSCTAS